MKAGYVVLSVVALIAIWCVPVFAQAPSRAMTWTGVVDDTTIVYVHADNAYTRTIRGKDAQVLNVEFDGRLPHRPVDAFISDWSGRGTVRVVEEPTPFNDFTAAVRIHDLQPGASQYSFTLNWRPRFDGELNRGE